MLEKIPESINRITVDADIAHFGARPFLKWAGGKRLLLPKLLPSFPQTFDRYYEPFLGSASIYFALSPKLAVLGDKNESLVGAYCVVRDQVDAVISLLKKWPYEEAHYYHIRDEYRPRSPLQAATRFIYLNKTCWNGLYRENLKGQFNVPFGNVKSGVYYSEDVLRGCSAALAGADIVSGDFADVVASATEGDFVFFDPPYVTGHNNNGFVEYNAKLFTWEDQQRLARLARRLVERGVKVAVTNAAHFEIKKLYAGFSLKRISRFNTLAGDIAARKLCDEFLLTGGY